MIPLIRIKFTFALDAQAFPLISVPMSVNSTMCVEFLQILFFQRFFRGFLVVYLPQGFIMKWEGFFFPAVV